jgi:hypothetical protein
MAGTGVLRTGLRYGSGLRAGIPGRSLIQRERSRPKPDSARTAARLLPGGLFARTASAWSRAVPAAV